MLMIDTDRNRELAKKWGVRGIPDMRYLDTDGKEVGKYKGRRTADSFVQEFSQISTKYAGKAKDEKIAISWISEFAKAREESTKNRKALFVIFSDESGAVSKTLDALTNGKLKKLVEHFVFANVKFDKESDVCKKLKVEAAGSIVLLNPDESDLAKSILARQLAPQGSDDLKAFLEPYEKPGFECEKCKKTSFTKQSCDGADMKPVKKD